MIRVFVISGICLYREGLTEMLDRTGLISVVASASDVTEALGVWDGLDELPEVILLDTVPPDADFRIRELLAALPDARVLALTVPNREREILAIAEAGIAGFVTSDASVAELVAAIESVSRGESLCSPSVVAALLRRLASMARGWADPTEPLTTREREILELIDEGLSNKQIAQRLRIELPTVKNHVHHILGKLGVHRRAEAAALARAARAGSSPRN
ncbi:MAG TPA: response regulator transcription factor [Gaiellaceae bacterium]|nr:response regulator transcription factor [Gaiellaceae bacterium]